MRCFHVLVHGRLDWLRKPTEAEGDDHGVARATGFYCHHYVLGSNEQDAAQSAFARARKNLERQTGWISRGLLALELEAEEVTPAPMRKLLQRVNRGHTFYTDD